MIRRWATESPYLFVLVVFIVEQLLAIPFVAVFRLTGMELEPLRLIIPIAHSAYALALIGYLGWFRQTGFVRDVRNINVYWWPVLFAFVPALVYGSVVVPAGPLLFFTAALFFTGLSEESISRGLILRALLPKGKWVAVLAAGILFSIGHLSNLAFEDFSVLEMVKVLLSTLGFAILYGAVFLRTGNIWPLIILHTVHDYIFLTSGTAGPFVVEPIALHVSITTAVISIAYGSWVMSRVTDRDLARLMGAP